MESVARSNPSIGGHPHRDPGTRRMLVYLAVIAVFYFLVGVAALFVVDSGLERFRGAHSPWLGWPCSH
jgi:hypothetical protein